MSRELLLIGMLASSAALGCVVIGDQSRVSPSLDDNAIAARVKARFTADSRVRALALDVETLQGVVYLGGFVQSQADRDRAESLARQVDGVREVQNDTIVKP